MNGLKLTFISDTHDCEPFDLGSGDILFHCGDLTYQGKKDETKRQLKWIGEADYKYKVIIPGNHELDWERKPYSQHKRYCKENNIHLLVDNEITIEGIKIYGSPRTPEFCGWAYMHLGEAIKKYWDNIPEDTDILLTHGPPKGILDVSKYSGKRCGCPYLQQRVMAVKPKIHSFGHMHEGHGYRDDNPDTLFINAAIMDSNYNPTNKPTRVIWDKELPYVLQEGEGWND